MTLFFTRNFFLKSKNASGFLKNFFLKSKKCARYFTFFTYHYIIFYCRNANRSANPTSVKIHSAEAVKLMEEADVPLEGPWGKDALQNFQRITENHRITVWEVASPPEQPKSPPEQPKLYFEGDSLSEKTITLFLDKQRFSVITDIGKFFGFKYFLPCCQKFYNYVYDAKHYLNGPCRKNHAEILPTY